MVDLAPLPTDHEAISFVWLYTNHQIPYEIIVPVIDLQRSESRGASYFFVLLAVVMVFSGCGEEAESWVERPLEQDAMTETVGTELGTNEVEIMMSTAGDRRVEIEVTGGAADTLEWESLKQARFVGDAAERAVERIATEYEHASSIQTLQINFAKKTDLGMGSMTIARRYEYGQADISEYVNP